MDTDTIMRKILAIIKPDVDQHRVAFVSDRLLDLVEEVAEADREDGYESGYDLGYEDGMAEGGSDNDVALQEEYDRGFDDACDMDIHPGAN